MKIFLAPLRILLLMNILKMHYDRYESYSIKKGKPLQLAIYHIFNSYKKNRSPKFSNFLEHHKHSPLTRGVPIGRGV